LCHRSFGSRCRWRPMLHLLFRSRTGPRVGRSDLRAGETRVLRLGDLRAGAVGSFPHARLDGVVTKKVRVLVGDDHPMFRDGVVRALVMSGEVDVVAEADDGKTALELIKTHKPDVALLDYRMPGLDGAEVAAAVRRDELSTRVLLLSAHDE